MKYKKIERKFQPRNINFLKFTIEKVNKEKIGQLSESEKISGLTFIKTCIDDLKQFSKLFNS